MSRFSKLETGTPGQLQGVEPQQPQTVRQAAAAARAAVAGAEVQYDYDHYFREAERCFYGGDHKQGLKLYSRAIQADHAQIAPWIGQALCLLEMKQWGEAMVWVKRGLELFPEDSRLISVEGAVYAHKGMVQRGLGASDYAIRLKASDPLVWVMRAEVLCLADNKNYQFCLDKAMETANPDDWKVPMLVGMFMLRQKKWTQAVEFLKKATARHTSSPYLWTKLGYAYEKLGFSQQAMDAYAAANEAGPSTKMAADQAISRVASTPFLVRIFRRIFR